MTDDTAGASGATVDASVEPPAQEGASGALPNPEPPVPSPDPNLEPPEKIDPPVILKRGQTKHAYKGVQAHPPKHPRT